MDTNDLVNAELNDEATDVVADSNIVTDTPADTGSTVETVATPADDTPEPTTVVVPVKPKSAAGRKVDHTGKTALGAARILYAANPTLSTKELRALFVQELGPKFNTSEAVAQTYVSLVRKPKKAAA